MVCTTEESTTRQLSVEFYITGLFVTSPEYVCIESEENFVIIIMQVMNNQHTKQDKVHAGRDGGRSSIVQMPGRGSPRSASCVQPSGRESVNERMCENFVAITLLPVATELVGGRLASCGRLPLWCSVSWAAVWMRGATYVQAPLLSGSSWHHTISALGYLSR